MNAIIDREMTYGEMAEQSRLKALGELYEAMAFEVYAQADEIEARSNPEYAEFAGRQRALGLSCRKRSERHTADWQTYLAKAEKESPNHPAG